MDNTQLVTGLRLLLDDVASGKRTTDEAAKTIVDVVSLYLMFKHRVQEKREAQMA